MPSTPRGRDVATLCAAVLTVVLAFAWLRSSDGVVPAVPAGLPVTTLPAMAPDEPSAPSEAAPSATGSEGERAGGDQTVRKPRKAARSAKRNRGESAAAQKAKQRHAGRAGGGEDARARRQAGARQGGRDRVRQDPPAATSAPKPGSAAPDVRSGSGSEPAPPEFALE